MFQIWFWDFTNRFLQLSVWNKSAGVSFSLAHKPAVITRCDSNEQVLTIEIHLDATFTERLIAMLLDSLMFPLCVGILDSLSCRGTQTGRWGQFAAADFTLKHSLLASRICLHLTVKWKPSSGATKLVFSAVFELRFTADLESVGTACALQLRFVAPAKC